jgi:hypothetical protein
MMRLRFLGILLAMVSAFVFLPTATGTSLADTASTETTFTAFNCIVINGGHKTVPAGSTVVMRQVFLDPRPGALTAFVNGQTTLVSVNDGQMSDVSNQWSASVLGPDGNFGITLGVPTGVTLANPGDEMRFTFSMTLSSTTAPVPGDPSTQGKPGLLFGGTCIVTAT